MQRSPYTPGVVASWLPGREGALARIDARLQINAAAGWQPERPVVEVGPRGLGKTSLLRQAQRHAQDSGQLAVWVSAGSEAGLVADLIAEIQRATASWSGAARRRLGRTIREVTVTVGVPGAVQIATTLSPHQDTVGPAPFGEFLRSTCEQAAKEHHRGVVLFIDEIQDADRAGLRTVALAWQHLQSEPPAKGAVSPPAMVCAGLPNSAAVLTAAASYTERWEYEQLGPLIPEAAAAALSGPARYLGVDWHPAALDGAVQFSRGLPFIVQLIGHYAWEQAGNPDPGTTITSDDFHAATARVEAELIVFYQGRWERATPKERQFLAAMARFGDGPVSRAGIAEALGVRTQDLGVPRASLISKGIVVADGYGHLSFTVPGFADYVRSVATDNLPETDRLAGLAQDPRTATRNDRG